MARMWLDTGDIVLIADDAGADSTAPSGSLCAQSSCPARTLLESCQAGTGLDLVGKLNMHAGHSGQRITLDVQVC